MESTNFDDMKEEIKDCKTLEEINRMSYVVNELNILVKRRKKKLLLENHIEIKPKTVSRSSMNIIAKFLNEEIFPGNKQELKTSVLYDRYKKWNRQDPNEKRDRYSKNKFYRILKLGRRIHFKHTITGDYFIFDLDKEKQTPDLIP